jgi:alpha-D-ribose 1-methylphosphonate 5-triphosphate synthase subunit PhnI
MYVAVKGGQKAIENSLKLLAIDRRGDLGISELSVDQIREQLGLGVARVMNEGSLYDPELAALAIKQAQGDLVEACFLLRAYRATLPRFGFSEAIETSQMKLSRRISATFKDVPGGQILGSTYDYTQRLMDFSLLGSANLIKDDSEKAQPEEFASVMELLAKEDLIELEKKSSHDPDPIDITRTPLRFPAPRSARLQNLLRSDEGFLLGVAYSTQRGYGFTHPFAAEIRHGEVNVQLTPEELDFPIDIGDIEMTECHMINQFSGNHTHLPKFTKGYGLVFGHHERKAMAMSLVDRALRAEEFGEPIEAPAQMQEFVLSHSDNLESSGFVQHLKLPHYVDFQSELELLRGIREAFKKNQEGENEA